MSIQTYRDLTSWQSAKQLTLTIYKLTASFPEEEKFGIANQMRRAGVSISSNIAEGFARIGTKEKIQFYYMALGSLSELESQAEISFELDFLSKSAYEQIRIQTQKTGKLLNGLIRSLKK
jgi:four helix bundle protein